MPRFAQVVMGPAGSGKSTYCSALVQHCEVLKRPVRVVNLDPAAEIFNYPIYADVRDLISVDDVMKDEELHYGPNGGLVFCLEYLASNLDWLEEVLGDDDDDYVLFDCPGQIELYMHLPVMPAIVRFLERRLHFRVCSVYLLDSHFVLDSAKLVAGALSACAATMQIETAHFNVLSKVDLLSKAQRKRLSSLLEPDLPEALRCESKRYVESGMVRYAKLHKQLATLVADSGLINFVPLNVKNERTIDELLYRIDSAIQFFDEQEPRESAFTAPEPLESENEAMED